MSIVPWPAGRVGQAAGPMDPAPRCPRGASFGRLESCRASLHVTSGPALRHYYPALLHMNEQPHSPDWCPDPLRQRIAPRSADASFFAEKLRAQVLRLGEAPQSFEDSFSQNPPERGCWQSRCLVRT
ncbi:hypothetical protein SBV1_390005 [Verrucomicrobia bacterium]|nr:hypothetical protein SBV1_390005 [Verrucomicrobiota bacterium]